MINLLLGLAEFPAMKAYLFFIILDEVPDPG
jgi:hypothetical protein